MGYLRFRRTKKILPGVRLNINKNSLGVSVGVRGLRKSINTKGQTHKTVGLPGTGLSYTERASTKGKPKRTKAAKSSAPSSSEVRATHYTGSDAVPVAGTDQHQAELAEYARRAGEPGASFYCLAILQPDERGVAVEINSWTVGSLTPADTDDLRSGIADATVANGLPVACDAAVDNLTGQWRVTLYLERADFQQ